MGTKDNCNGDGSGDTTFTTDDVCENIGALNGDQVQWIGEIVNLLAAGAAGGTAFPEGQTGDISRTNGLFRLNYFNGRFLTAEALRKEQTYWDTRARLVAQIHPPGIAWGLGLRVGVDDYPAIREGLGQDTRYDWTDVWAYLDCLNSLVVSTSGTGQIERICQRNKLSELTSLSPEQWESIREQLVRLEEQLGSDCSGAYPAGYAQLMADDGRMLLAWCRGDSATGGQAPEPQQVSDPYSGGGIPSDETICLSPGVAFDGVGRPIVVGSSEGFTFGELLDDFVTKPRTIVSGGTQFAPCVCLEPTSISTQDGVAVTAGAYLLVITPEERPEGEAKVYGTACPSPGAVHCETDGWRGGFGLSLVRYPTTVPVDQVQSAWDLRGVLAAHYFDVYEHSLAKRWPAGFAADGAWCQGPGPFQRLAGAVPLAMVYVGTNGSVLWMDPWIPRRPQVATATHDWHANMLGRPTSSACFARVQQFQCQLADSLAAQDRGLCVETYGRQLNLLERGFRHIPPFGFLPVNTESTWTDALAKAVKNPLQLLVTESAAICEAKTQAKEFFAGTNVFTWTCVAVHDDDILEEMVKAMHKDPVSLARPATPGRDALAGFLSALSSRKAGLVQVGEGDTRRPSLQLSQSSSGLTQLGVACWMLTDLFDLVGMTMEQLVNRELEIVRLFVPLEGLRRQWPVIGRVEGDPLVDSFSMLTGALKLSNVGDFATFLVEDFLGSAARPRSFVFYVKQRIVIWDLIYVLLDAILDLAAVIVAWLGPIMAAIDAVSQADEREDTDDETDDETDADAEAGAVGLGRPSVFVEDGQRSVTRATGYQILSNQFRTAGGRDTRFKTYSTQDLRKAGGLGLLKAGASVARILDQPFIKEQAFDLVERSQPQLANDGFWLVYDRERRERESRLRGAGVDAKTAKVMARDQSIDLMLEEYPAAGVLKAAFVLLPEDDAETWVGDYRKHAGVERIAAEPASQPLVGRVFHRDSLTPWAGSDEKALYRAAREEFDRRRVGEGEAEVNELLRRDVSEVDAETAKRLEEEGAVLVAAVNELGGRDAIHDVAFWDEYDKRLEATGTVSDALTAMSARGPADKRHSAKALKDLESVLGEEATVRFMGKVRSSALTR